MKAAASHKKAAKCRGYAASFAALLAVLAVALGPPLAAGRVLYAHDNAPEAGIFVPPSGFTQRNIDPWHLFVPEMHAHVACEHASWIATWNPHNELGRPLFPLGVGRAFIVGHALSRLVDDGFLLFTWTAVSAVVATAVFAFLFLRELGLRPAACFAGATAISLGPLCVSWPFTPILQWDFCWAFASLFAGERWLTRRTPWSWLGLAFSVHAILLTGYAEHFVLLGWMVAGWLLMRTLETRKGARERLFALAGILGATLAGVVAVAPAYLDLFVTWRLSVRADFPAVTKPLFPPEPLDFWLRFYDVFLVERHMRAPDPEGHPNLSSVLAGLVAIALPAWRRRRAWYWIGWSAFALAATFSPLLIRGLRVLGLVFSDWPPLYAAVLPLAVVAALGADRALGALGAARRRHALAAAAPLAAAALFAPLSRDGFDQRLGVVSLLLGAGVVAFALVPRQPLLVGLVAAVALLHAFLVAPWQPRTSLHTDSPLAAELRARTSDGSRFAWVGKRPSDRFLVPNQEIVLGLASIHTYDHFISRQFDAWARPLRSVPPRAAYERRFLTIHRDAHRDLALAALCGVSTILASSDIPGLGKEVARHGPVRVYEPSLRGPLQALLPAGTFELTVPGHATAAPAAALGGLPVERLETGAHDRLRFAFAAPDTEALLFVSQQHDPRWRARAAGRELATVVVDDLFQGVLVPPGTSEVELAFEPWIRWQIVPQALFGLAGMGAVIAAWRGRRRAPRGA